MDIFWVLVFKMIPLYLIILLGYLAEKKFQINKENIANLLIYILTPAITFLGTYNAGLQWELLSLPLIFCVVCVVLTLLHWPIAKLFWKDGTENIVAFSAGNGNSGYFGIPVCLALLGPDSLPVAVMIGFGFTLCQDTLGYYIMARHEYTAKKALQKVLRLPPLYAFLAGILCNIFGIQISDILLDTMHVLEGGYVPLGMMTIGFGLYGVRLKDFDLKLTVSTLFTKFIIWPAMIWGIIWIDALYFHLFSDFIAQTMMIISLVPIAANTVVFAEELHDHPEKAALIVIISTVIALFYIPAMVGWLF